MVTTNNELSTRVRPVFLCCLATKIGTMQHVEYGTCEKPKRHASLELRFHKSSMLINCAIAKVSFFIG